MNKPPITILETLQSDLNDGTSSWDNRLFALTMFGTKDLEATIEGIKQMVADYESRLAVRDEEIMELEKHVDHETYFNRLSEKVEVAIAS